MAKGLKIPAAAGDSKDALLIVFGDIAISGRMIKAETIYEILTRHQAWLSSRRIQALPGTPVLFYRVSVGFVGSASIVSVEGRRDNEPSLLRSFPDQMYPYKIHLSGVRTFSRTFNIRPLIPRLSFITNKTYWGHSFRTSPRRIPFSDYRLILETADERDA